MSERFTTLAEHTRFAADKLAKQNLFESERFFCDLYCLEPGQSQRPHTHGESDKVYVVLTGEVVVRIAAQERTLGPGGAAHAAPGEEHSLHNAGAAQATVLVFMTPKP